MAYVNKAKKAKIAAALKPVMPAGWKYSLAVRNHSTIVLTISEAPVDIIRAHKPAFWSEYLSLNPYHYSNHFDDVGMVSAFDKIFEALNTDNFDESDIMTDYFHVGHYVDVQIGRWNKPFKVTV